MDLLFDAISELLCGDIMHNVVILRPEQGRLRALLFEENAVLQDEYDEHGNARVEVRMQKSDFERLLSRSHISRADLSFAQV